MLGAFLTALPVVAVIAACPGLQRISHKCVLGVSVVVAVARGGDGRKHSGRLPATHRQEGWLRLPVVGLP